MRLIDGEKLFEYLGDVPWTEFKKHKVLRAVYNAPTIDAEPVKHGEWKEERNITTDGKGYTAYRCSVCQCAVLTKLYNFCPNCGAKNR